MMNDEDRDKLAGILYAAYEGPGVDPSWEDLKRQYPSLKQCWLRAADAAVQAIVVVKIGDE